MSYASLEKEILTALSGAPNRKLKFGELVKNLGHSRAGIAEALDRLEKRKDIERHEMPGKMRGIAPVEYELKRSYQYVSEKADDARLNYLNYPRLREIIQQILGSTEIGESVKFWMLSELFGDVMGLIHDIPGQLGWAVISALHNDKSTSQELQRSFLLNYQRFAKVLFDLVLRNPIVGLAFIYGTEGSAIFTDFDLATKYLKEYPGRKEVLENAALTAVTLPNYEELLRHAKGRERTHGKVWKRWYEEMKVS